MKIAWHHKLDVDEWYAYYRGLSLRVWLDHDGVWNAESSKGSQIHICNWDKSTALAAKREAKKTVDRWLRPLGKGNPKIEEPISWFRDKFSGLLSANYRGHFLDAIQHPDGLWVVGSLKGGFLCMEKGEISSEARAKRCAKEITDRWLDGHKPRTR